MEVRTLKVLALAIGSIGLSLVLIVSGCSQRRVHHVVKPGETLSVIGRAYGVPYEKIARSNGISDASRIYVGQRLLIPGAEKAIEKSLASPGSAAPSNRGAIRRSSSRHKPPGAPDLRWPIEGGTITSLFGRRGSRYHDGIDIAASLGSPVRAAAAGQVTYDGKLSGYGNVVIIRHGSGYSTVYAHNDRHYVDEGQWVKRGDRIAGVGRTGRATGPNLHFEVRHRNVARDPMLFLPRERSAGLRTNAID